MELEISWNVLHIKEYTWICQLTSPATRHHTLSGHYLYLLNFLVLG